MRPAAWLGSSIALIALVLIAATALANQTSSPAAAGLAGVPRPGWLQRLNLHRAAAKLPLIAIENASWSDGCAKHALYMVKNHAIGHSEVDGNAWYTDEGHECAQNSNVLGSSLPKSDEEAIDGWMAAPFHAVGMLDPHLEESGFGSYREDTNMFPEMAAALDVWRGLGPVPNTVSFPVIWPGDGQTTPLTEYSGNELPEPLASCPGYDDPVGLPLIVQLGTGSISPVNVTAHSFAQGVNPLESCVFSESDYTNPNAQHQSLGRSVLGGRDAIVLIPRDPLVDGNEYTASVTANGVTHTWTFGVSGGVLPPGTSTPSETRTPSFTPTITPTRTPTRTPTITPTRTPTRTPTPSPTRTPTRTPTPAATSTGTLTPSATPTLTSTPTATATATATSTPTMTATPTATATATATSTPTPAASTESPAPTATITSAGLTPTPTATPAATAASPEPATATPPLAVVTTTPTQSPANLTGDSNCDQQIDALDTLALLQFSAGLLAVLPCGEAADVNGDGSSNALDGALILQYVAGLITDFPAGEAAGDVPIIRIGSLTQAIDEEGGVTIEERNMPLPGLGAWTIDVQYDGGVVTATGCVGLADGLCNPAYDVNTARAVGAVPRGGFVGNQALATLIVRCTAEGQSALHITIHLLADSTAGDPQPIAASTQDGTIVCSARTDILGDVDCDGEVTAIDAALILQLDAGIIGSLPCEQNADIDDDGRITSIDAALILQHVAGLIGQL